MQITFPEYANRRCLMMPFIQGDPDSLPDEYKSYSPIIEELVLESGEIGHLTIDESEVIAGTPHRGARARHDRAIHTEVGPARNWGGGGGWGGKFNTVLDESTRILVASNRDNTCAVWKDRWYPQTLDDGDMGHVAHLFPIEDATLLQAGEVAEMGIWTPHESLPAQHTMTRSFIRIIGQGVSGREEYFTPNPLVAV